MSKKTSGKYKIGDRVYLKNQKGKREGIIELFSTDFADKSNALIQLDTGQQKITRLSNLGFAKDKAIKEKIADTGKSFEESKDNIPFTPSSAIMKAFKDKEKGNGKWITKNGKRIFIENK